MNSMKFDFVNKVVLRKPANANKDLVLKFKLENALDYLPLLKENLYLYSKDLLESVERYNSLTDKAKLSVGISLYKYLARMSFRPTPFGLLAGLLVTQWSDSDDSKLKNPDLNRISGLDGDCVYSIYDALIENRKVLEHVDLYLNDTALINNSKISIYHRKYTSVARLEYQLKEFSCSKKDALHTVVDFVSNGCSYSDLIEFIANKGFSTNDSRDFVSSLISENLLTTSIDPIPDSRIYLQHLKDHLKESHSEVVSQLETINDQLLEIDHNRQNTRESVALIVSALDRIKGLREQKKCPVKIDLVGSKVSGGISKKHQGKIIEGFDVLTTLHRSAQDLRLENFKNRLRNKYEEKFVALLDVFSSETDIIYLPELSGLTTPLISGFQKSTKRTDLEFALTPLDSFLFKSYNKAILEGKREIVLDLNEIGEDEPIKSNIPQQIQVFVKLLSNGRILFINAKSNPTSFIGRFNNNNEIRQLQREIINLEEAESPNKIIAELIHIPNDLRSLNVMNNHEIRDFHIPIMGNSWFKNSSSIKLEDISIGIRKNRIILFSKTHKKEILPRLTSALNTNISSNVPIFRFLSDLAHQETTVYEIKWPRFMNNLSLDFLPRIRYKKIIYQPATWILRRSNFQKEILSTDKFKTKFKNFIKSFELPDKVLLKNDDNKLFLDLTNENISYEILRKEMIKSSHIEIEEYLESDENLGENEILAYLTSPLKKTKSNEVLSFESVESVFPALGSGWICMYIYLSEKKAETIIFSPEFKELIDYFHRENIVSLWFYVRYIDSEGPHLRLRFKVCKGASDTDIVEKLKSFFLKRELIDFRLMPYKREIDRYKGELVVDSENLFHHQSNLLISLIPLIKTKCIGDFEDVRWQIGLYLIDSVLQAGTLSLQEKIELSERMKKSFNEEFSLGKEEFKKINKKYRREEKQIHDILSNTFFEPKINEMLLSFRDRIQVVLGQIKAKCKKSNDYSDLLRSYIHMFLNRLFLTLPREHELYLYNFINRYYKYLGHIGRTRGFNTK